MEFRAVQREDSSPGAEACRNVGYSCPYVGPSIVSGRLHLAEIETADDRLDEVTVFNALMAASRLVFEAPRGSPAAAVLQVRSSRTLADAADRFRQLVDWPWWTARCVLAGRGAMVGRFSRSHLRPPSPYLEDDDWLGMLAVRTAVPVLDPDLARSNGEEVRAALGGSPLEGCPIALELVVQGISEQQYRLLRSWAASVLRPRGEVGAVEAVGSREGGDAPQAAQAETH